MNLFNDIDNELWKSKGIIYCYTNKVNNKKYIGQTVRSLKVRHGEHMSDSYKNKARKYNYAIHHAIRKYGIENFTLEILVMGCFDYDKLNDYEAFFIKRLNSVEHGYNIASGGKNGNSTYGKTDEEKRLWRERISETRDIKGNKNPMYGKKHSEHSKLKNKMNHQGVKVIRIDDNNNKKIYDYLRDVLKDGFDRRHVKKCCEYNLTGEEEFYRKHNTRCMSHKGYKWYYLDDYNNKLKELDDN